jgi:hypothetical protein
LRIKNEDFRTRFAAMLVDGNIHACWSPDSRRIAYCARMLNPDLSRAGETSIFVTDPDGKNTVTVATEKHEPNIIALQLTDWR